MKPFAYVIFFLGFKTMAQMPEVFQERKSSTILLYKTNSQGLQPHGTGILIFNYDSAKEDIIVTCEHLTHNEFLIVAIPALDSVKNELIKDHVDSLVISYQNKPTVIYFDGSNFLVKISLKNNINVFKHPSLDLCVIYCRLPSYISTMGKIVHLFGSKGIAKALTASKSEFFAGQDVFFIGYPFGIGTTSGFMGLQYYKDKKANPLIRKGTIAWVSDNSDEFLIDGFSFGGNSGSPIFALSNENNWGMFMGMITGHLNETFVVDHFWVDTTRTPAQVKVLNKEIEINNGLARFIPSYVIREFVDQSLILRKNNLNIKN